MEPPTDYARLVKSPVWFTDYIDFLVDEDLSASAVPLLDARGEPFKVSLRRADWCRAANEGTIAVLLANHETRSYNFAGRASHPITDCADVLAGFGPKTIQAINESVFSELPPRASFGTGVKSVNCSESYRLVPGRSVAIDLSENGKFRIGQVLYIPQLRKVTLTLPNGQMVHHDGYVMAVDKVSACSGGGKMPANCNYNHLDYFKGRSRSDALPTPLGSDPGHPLDAYIVIDPSVISKLKGEHCSD